MSDTKRNADWVLHHDDPPCEERLLPVEGGGFYCTECKLHPDSQSLCLKPYCPDCGRLLLPTKGRLRCLTCGELFKTWEQMKEDEE